MKLILIHGRAQEEFDEHDLKKEWIEALNRGLEKSGLVLPDEVKVEFPYYGKLLQQLIQEALAPPAPGGKIKRGDGDPALNEAKEMEFYAAYLEEMAIKSATTPEEKAELAAILITTRDMENNAIVQKLLSFLDRNTPVGTAALKYRTKDVFMYLSKPGIKSRINAYVEKSFDTEPCVVVAHSLGSVVGYLVLKNNPQYQVQQLITIGSPLGVKAIRNHLDTPLRMPQCIKNGWFNAYDERDVVALNPLNKRHFNIPAVIENKNDVDNHTDNRHGVVGYLDDAVVARKIYRALYF